jgi:hypothetical protein
VNNKDLVIKPWRGCQVPAERKEAWIQELYDRTQETKLDSWTLSGDTLILATHSDSIGVRISETKVVRVHWPHYEGQDE